MENLTGVLDLQVPTHLPVPLLAFFFLLLIIAKTWNCA